jgi:hypothetical protein
MRVKRDARYPVMVEVDGRAVKSPIVASVAEAPAQVSMRVRQEGWEPYRVRFDESQAAWIVSSLASRRATA